MPRPRDIQSRLLNPNAAQIIGGATGSAIYDPEGSVSDGVYGTLGEALAAVKGITDGPGVVVVRPSSGQAPATIPAAAYDFDGRIGLAAPPTVGNNHRPVMLFADGSTIDGLPWISGLVVGSLSVAPLITYTAGAKLDLDNTQLIATGVAPTALIEVNPGALAALELSLSNGSELFNGLGIATPIVDAVAFNTQITLKSGSEISPNALRLAGLAQIAILRGIDCRLSLIQPAVDPNAPYVVSVVQPWEQSPTVVTASYQASASEFVRYDSTGGTFPIFLPNAVVGVEVLIKNNTADATAVTITPHQGIGSIDGSPTFALAGSRAFLRLFKLSGAGAWAIVSN